MKHVLIVDDSATVRIYHGEILRRAGWQVEEAANGLSALERALARPADAPFDLYVVDVNMPKMDGHAFIRALRGETGAGAAPVLVVSSVAPPVSGFAPAGSESNAWLVKPLTAESLALTAALLTGDREGALAATRGEFTP